MAEVVFTLAAAVRAVCIGIIESVSAWQRIITTTKHGFNSFARVMRAAGNGKTRFLLFEVNQFHFKCAQLHCSISITSNRVVVQSVR